MAKSKKFNINDALLEAHKLSVSNAIEAAARSGVPLVVYIDGKVKQIEPAYKYIRVENKPSTNKKTSRSHRK